NKKGYSGSLTSFFSVWAVQPIIFNPYPTDLYLKAPYTGTISVDISTQHYSQAINLSSCVLSLTGPNGSISLATSTTVFSTQSVRLVGTPIIPLIAEGSYEIEAKAKDESGNGGSPVKFSFNLSLYLPLVSVYLSPPLFSPYTSIDVYDTAIISFSCDENSTYTVTVDDRELKNAKGVILASETVFYAWDGRDQSNGIFTEGSHTIKVACENMVGKIGTKTLIVTIDSTSPEVKMDVSDYIFSPGTSAGSQDTTKVSFTIGTESATYTLKVDGKTPTGIGSVTGFLPGSGSAEFIWNGSHTTGECGTGTHIVEVEVVDFAGNTSSKTSIVTIDRNWPCITAITNNTGGQCFYKDEVIVFTLYADTDVQTATTYLGTSAVNLQKISAGIFSGSYIVKTGDFGVGSITGFIIDSAGNSNTNPTKVFGTITVDGSHLPSENIFPRIIRIGALLPEERGLQFATKTTTGSMTIDCSSENLVNGQKVKVIDTSNEHIWVAAIAQGTVTLDNGNLYYGSPVPDYRNITIGSAFALKTLAKGGDKIAFSISCDKAEKSFFPVIINQITGSLTLSDSNIKTGETILVGVGNNFWRGLAIVAGSFTISNANLYSGPLVSDYSVLSGLTCEKVSFAVGGDASIDIGSIIKGIPLADTGLCGDIKPGDGVYSGLYTIKNGDDGQDVPVFGHFLYNKQSATNDRYTDSRITVSMDGTPPKIESIGAQPSPFNPYLGNLNIKYSLSESSCIVTIKIENKYGELVRRLVPPEPQQGENVDTYWDGSDNMGNRVLDDSYYYTV
ncbi:MAG: FlgD immunoglobulin-like domain containing protein, partial [Candidatus Desantisbacteria bacterium]